MKTKYQLSEVHRNAFKLAVAKRFYTGPKWIEDKAVIAMTFPATTINPTVEVIRDPTYNQCYVVSHNNGVIQEITAI